jgi:hypothetical protein
MQLVAAAVTSPAEHVARRPARAAIAAAADADVRKLTLGERMIYFNQGRLGSSGLKAVLLITAVLLMLTYGFATAPSEDLDEVELSLCSGTDQMEAQLIAEDWLTLKYGGRFNFAILWWEPLCEGDGYMRGEDGRDHKAVGCILAGRLRPVGHPMTGKEDHHARFLFQGGKLVSARETEPMTPTIIPYGAR